MAVEVVKSLVVPPSEETPRHGLWLSALDLLHAKRGHTPTVYLYPRHSADQHDFFDVDRLKDSLGKALVPFYPLAGRLSVGGDGRPEIDCAGQGVHLVIARSSNLTVDDLSGYQPSLEVKKLFVPQIIDEEPSIMCAIQVTHLKCGGVAFGAALHHALIDGTSACNFYKAWSAFSRSKDGGLDVELELPCHDHTLLQARTPPATVIALSEPPPPCGRPTKGPFIQEIFSISKDQVAALKSACSSGSAGGRISTFCAVSAHVWRCMCIARGLAPEATTQLTFLANFRRTVRPALPDSYFGNAFIELGVVTKVEDIIFASSDSADHLASIAGRVRDGIRTVGNEFVRSKIDCLESGVGQLPAGSMPETDVIIVSWLGMPVYHNDFGWGKPQSLMLAEQQHAGLVYLMDGGQGDGSVNVMCTEAGETLRDFKRLLYATYSH